MWSGHRSVDPTGGMNEPDPSEALIGKITLLYKVFIIAVLMGGLLWGLANPVSSTSLREIVAPLGPIVELLREEPFAAALLIYANNIRVSVLVLVPFLGPILLGYNLFIVGSIIAMNPLLTLPYILPHGVIELAGLIYACSLSGVIVRGIAMGRFWDNVSTVMHRWLKVVVPVLLVAALVEAYVTPLVAPLITSLLWP